METATGILIASSIQTLIHGAQLQEQSEWGILLDSPLFRYILIFTLMMVITKNWKTSILILFYWILTKSILKIVMTNTRHWSNHITPPHKKA